MDIQHIIRTIHERRVGIDMIMMPYKEETYYADPDQDREGFVCSGDYEIPRF